MQLPSEPCFGRFKNEIERAGFTFDEPQAGIQMDRVLARLRASLAALSAAPYMLPTPL